MNVSELKRWLSTIPDTSSIAIDQGGLRLVEIDNAGNLTEAQLEIDGIPNEVLAKEHKGWIDPDDAPPLTKEFFVEAIRRVPVKVLTVSTSTAELGKRDASTLKTLDSFLDEDGIREEVTTTAKDRLADARERAMRSLDGHFGLGKEQVHQAVRTDPVASAIYHAALKVVQAHILVFDTFQVPADQLPKPELAMEGSMSQVVNAHWFGGADKLPPNTVYIGRPSLYGNRHSSKSGLYTREECIALHRVDLYNSLTDDPRRIEQIRRDLGGHDLACWCKQPKRLVGCHGDNFLHILSDRLAYRKYDETVVFYLMDDLRYVLKLLEEWIRSGACHSDYLALYIHFDDVRLCIREALRVAREKHIDTQELCFFIAQVVVDLELAAQEKDVGFLEYRFAHALWAANRFVLGRIDRFGEPDPPTVLIKRKSVKKSTDEPDTKGDAS